MTHGHPRTLLQASNLIAPVFTKPGFGNALVVLVGWVLTRGRHAVTQALVATGVAARRHHAAFHSFFSRGTWSPDELGLVLRGKIVELLRERRPHRRVHARRQAVPQEGPAIFGLGTHLDAVLRRKPLPTAMQQRGLHNRKTRI
jgi:hypothetical protein